MLKRFIGDRAFYRRLFTVAVPIIVQSGITNFVSLLDNIMVGQVGTIPMSGVSIVNGLIFIFNLCCFGACSGAGIFTAQFNGSGDQEGVRHTVRFKLMVSLLIALGGGLIFTCFGDRLVGLYLTGEGDAADAAAILESALRYLKVMIWGFLPFALSNAYASTLKESRNTVIPMIAGVSAVMVNLFLNYTLIFGHFGAPAMGVEGAALATVISRYVELAIVAGWTHLHPERCPYARGLYRSCRIPGKLFRTIVIKGMPLLVNEFFWATGMAMLNQCYSTCGLEVVPALNISSTLYNLAGVVYMSMGNATGILMGQMLGAGNRAEVVKEANRKMLFANVLAGCCFGGLMVLISGAFPALYNTTGQVRHLAGMLICINACIMPFNSFTHSTYFTLRSGGQTLVTFLFDSCFMWVCCVPVAFCLSRFTGISILPLFAICQATDLLKCTLGAIMLHQGKWIQNLTV